MPNVATSTTTFTVAPRRRFIDRLEPQRYGDRATLDQFLSVWTDVFGERADWRVDVRHLSGWRAAN